MAPETQPDLHKIDAALRVCGCENGRAEMIKYIQDQINGAALTYERTHSWLSSENARSTVRSAILEPLEKLRRPNVGKIRQTVIDAMNGLLNGTNPTGEIDEREIISYSGRPQGIVNGKKRPKAFL